MKKIKEMINFVLYRIALIILLLVLFGSPFAMIWASILYYETHGYWPHF